EAAQLAAGLATASIRRETLTTVLGQWAAADPAAAANSLATVSDADERVSAASTIASNWAGADPDAAARWLASLPPDQVRAAAPFGSVLRLVRDSPERAAPGVMRVTDPRQRYNLVEQVARSGLRFDQRAAAAWLAQTDLPAQLKQQLPRDAATAPKP